MKKFLIFAVLAGLIFGVGGCIGGTVLTNYINTGYRQNGETYVSEDEDYGIVFTDDNFLIEQLDNDTLYSTVLGIPCEYINNEVYVSDSIFGIELPTTSLAGEFTDWHTFISTDDVRYVIE